MALSEFTFIDTKQSVWDLKITLLTAGRIDKSDFSELTSATFSFINPEKDLFSEIFVNTPFAMSLVWVIVQDQILENLITPQAKRLIGEPCESQDILESTIKELQADEAIDWELEFISDKRQYRVLGVFGPGRKEATLLVGCYHKQRVYQPPNALDEAVKRNKTLSEGRATRLERQIRTDY